MQSMEDFKKCIHTGFCGGCKYGNLPYEEQCQIKEKEVLENLEKNEITPNTYGGFEPCPLQHRYGYRNKMEYTFGDFVKDGPLCLGMHRQKSFMSIVTVDRCIIADPDFNEILKYTLGFAEDRGYKNYHKKRHDGLLRNLVVRKGARTGELLVNIVTSSEPGFDEEAYVDGLMNLALKGTIVGILRTFNDALADAVICDELKILYGRDYYMDEIAGLKFRVSAFSFFQTNVDAAERLYLEAIDLIDDFQDKSVFDLYCGTGTISQILARKANRVTGVELVEDAVLSARENAKLNGLDNCHFIAGDVFEVLKEVEEKPDVIVVDPPRMGMTPKAVDKIASYDVDQILYISCNPKTLAPNLKQLEFFGYRVEYLKAYDNFPGTKHTECVALLCKA